MKPFNLEQAKAGKPVCTRDGRKARIIIDESRKDDCYPFSALVDGERDEIFYTEKGKYDDAHNSHIDLFMIGEPHYCPFKSAEEVMEAIKVHGDWVKQGHDIYRRINKVTTIGSKVTISLSGMKDWGTNELENLGEFRFLDGTPFGKLVEE